MIGPLTALRRTWFATRKMRLPIPREALVLEVGSGDSPCPRSDVLLDLTLDDHERVGGRTIVDRPAVLGVVEQLPFRDQAFDYVIAFHVLEHSPNPDAFLRELQRVARAGYIETPAAWVERVHPLTMHRSEVGLEDTAGGPRLVIRHKASPIPDPDISSVFDRSAKSAAWFERIPREAVVTRYAWRDRIEYRIVNPETAIDWPSPPETTRANGVDPRSPLRRAFKKLAQLTHQPRRVDLVSLMRCTDCAHAPLGGTLHDGSLHCTKCGRRYTVTDDIPFMHPAGWTLR